MAETLHLKVVTPTGCVVDQRATAFTARSEMGELCILPGHCLLLTALVPGPMQVETADEPPTRYALDRGFLEAGPHAVNVITDHCLHPSDIDADQARKEIAELETALEAQGRETPEGNLTLQKLDWARARLSMAEQATN
jgi:F-type H+-transporting ATPase subunit epsilon